MRIGGTNRPPPRCPAHLPAWTSAGVHGDHAAWARDGIAVPPADKERRCRPHPDRHAHPGATSCSLQAAQARAGVGRGRHTGSRGSPVGVSPYHTRERLRLQPGDGSRQPPHHCRSRASESATCNRSWNAPTPSRSRLPPPLTGKLPSMNRACAGSPYRAPSRPRPRPNAAHRERPAHR